MPVFLKVRNIKDARNALKIIRVGEKVIAVLQC